MVSHSYIGNVLLQLHRPDCHHWVGEALKAAGSCKESLREFAAARDISRQLAAKQPGDPRHPQDVIELTKAIKTGCH